MYCSGGVESPTYQTAPGDENKHRYGPRPVVEALRHHSEGLTHQQPVEVNREGRWPGGGRFRGLWTNCEPAPTTIVNAHLHIERAGAVQRV